MLPWKTLKPSSLPPRFEHPRLDEAAAEWRRLDAGADHPGVGVQLSASDHRGIEP
jgi:hypothetical protein